MQLGRRAGVARKSTYCAAVRARTQAYKAHFAQSGEMRGWTPKAYVNYFASTPSGKHAKMTEELVRSVHRFSKKARSQENTSHLPLFPRHTRRSLSRIEIHVKSGIGMNRVTCSGSESHTTTLHAWLILVQQAGSRAWQVIIVVNFGMTTSAKLTPERYPRLILLHADPMDTTLKRSFNFNKMLGKIAEKHAAK